MKIEGQNLGDILVKLPWQYKIVVALGSLFILYTLAYLPYVFIYLKLKPKLEVSAPVTVTGAVQPLGMLDPSIAASADGQQIWMAFTSEEKPADGAAGGNTLSVRLATVRPQTSYAKAGAAGCKKWETWPSGFEAKEDSLLAPDGQTILRTGVWLIETPTLVYDPDDPGKEWKLFAYKYFWANDQKDIMAVAHHYGAIVYKYASDPAGEWSPEQWLFSPAAEYPPPPYQQTVLLHLNRLDPSLQDVTTYARPSAIYKGGLLIMTLSAFTQGTTPDRIIMIASRDHGNSWHYVGTVLQQSDIAAIDHTGILDGATLLQQDGQVYLAAVLGNAQRRELGTFIYGFDDLSQGRLRRDPATGVPMILNQVPLQGSNAGALGGGSAAYNDACHAGMLVTAQKGNTREFSIYNTRFKPFENKK